MVSPTFSTDPLQPLAGDASAVINLIATGCAPAILSALPNRLVVVDIVAAELEGGRQRRRQEFDRLNELAGAGSIEIVSLDDAAAAFFEELVIGAADATLDDGEAATIAYALTHSCAVIVDERKATRICRTRYPTLRVGCTVDLLTHREVQRRLGIDVIADAVFNALQKGRMRVMPSHVQLVIGLVGLERAAECLSLPTAVREPRQHK